MLALILLSEVDPVVEDPRIISWERIGYLLGLIGGHRPQLGSGQVKRPTLF